MPLLLIEELAKHLDLPADEISNALSELANQVKSDIDNDQPSEIPGVGTFTRVNDRLSFAPTETLAMAVNNRYAALDAEMIQLGFEEPDFPLSEALEQGNDQELDLDQSLVDQIVADDMASSGLFTQNNDSDAQANPIEELDPFDGDLLETELEKTNSPTQDELSSDPAVEPASMKEDDPNPQNPSNKDPLGSDTEWSPFFEELEGEEFDIDNTIDLSAEDWQAEIPAPPSSPFASSSDSSNTNADDLYFDVDADPDDTLFAPAGSIDVENPSNDDMSWASAPLDDVTDFFEDDPSMSSSFGEETESISAMSAEDEFFSPVSGSVNATPDDTMFSPEAIYTEDASTEADSTIFLAPDQTVQANVDADFQDAFAPPSTEEPIEPPTAAPEPPRNRNPYAYREERKKATSSFPWIAAVIGTIIVLSGGYFAFTQGWLPFGGATTEAPVTASTPIETPPETVNPAPATTDPAPNTATNTPVETPESTTQTPQITPAPPPPAQRISIDRSRGGWTVVVTSKEQRAEAEGIIDDFAEFFSSSNVAVDILTTNDFENTRYRGVIGQFASRTEASNFINRSGANLPQDAWLLRIE